MTQDTVLFNGNIWSQHKAGVPRLLSILLHLTLLTIALIPWSVPSKPLPGSLVQITMTAPIRLTLPLTEMGGGGGGGRRQPQPASLGRPPRAADRQMTPPDPEPPKNADPLLVVEQTVVAPQLASLPQLKLLSIGDPEGVAGPLSSGPGECCGIGSGKGHGVGPDKGPGLGPGEDGGYGGGRLHIGAGITSPVLVSEILPEYSEEARKARFEGTVILDTVVREDGSVQVIRVLRGAGFGLDEKAIAAVLKWKFRPGRKNGNPVAMALNVEVHFNLR